MADGKKTNIQLLRDFFGKLEPKEIIAFKNDDPKGYEQVIKGLQDGTYNY
jgi:hypothetical protein